jgi:tetratricopeptide (TPR) repeat protein
MTARVIELNERGLALQKEKNLEEALACFERLLTLVPDLVEGLYNHGNTLSDLRRYDEALESYDCVLAVRPDHVPTLNNRG